MILNSYLSLINLIKYLLIQINYDNKYLSISFTQSFFIKTVYIAWSWLYAYDTLVWKNTYLTNRGYISHNMTDHQKCRFVFSHSDVSCRIQNVWRRIKIRHYVKITIGIWCYFIVMYNMNVETFRFYEFYKSKSIKSNKIQIIECSNLRIHFDNYSPL